MDSESQYKEWISIAFGGLLFVSEILPYISKVKSNGIIQLMSNSLRNTFKKSDYQILLNEPIRQNRITNETSSNETSINMQSNLDSINRSNDVTEILQSNESNIILTEKLDKIIGILETLSKNKNDKHHNNEQIDEKLLHITDISNNKLNKIGVTISLN